MYGLRARCAAQHTLIVGMLLRATNFVYPVHLYPVQVYRVQVYRVQVYRVQGSDAIWVIGC